MCRPWGIRLKRERSEVFCSRISPPQMGSLAGPFLLSSCPCALSERRGADCDWLPLLLRLPLASPCHSSCLAFAQHPLPALLFRFLLRLLQPLVRHCGIFCFGPSPAAAALHLRFAPSPFAAVFPCAAFSFRAFASFSFFAFRKMS